MNKRERQPPRQDRKGRLEAALRENLRRRKAQARGRASQNEAETAHDSAGFGQEIAAGRPEN